MQWVVNQMTYYTKTKLANNVWESPWQSFRLFLLILVLNSQARIDWPQKLTPLNDDIMEASYQALFI